MMFRLTDVFGKRRMHFRLLGQIEQVVTTRDLGKINTCQPIKIEVTWYPQEVCEDVCLELKSRGFDAVVTTDTKGIKNVDVNNYHYKKVQYVRRLLTISPPPDHEFVSYKDVDAITILHEEPVNKHMERTSSFI